jgi:hypothetical protein
MDGCWPPAGPLPGTCANAVTPTRSTVAEHSINLLPIVFFVFFVVEFITCKILLLVGTELETDTVSSYSVFKIRFAK